jgi:hypothetical protein
MNVVSDFLQISITRNSVIHLFYTHLFSVSTAKRLSKKLTIIGKFRKASIRVCKILLNLNTSITVLKSRNTSIEQYSTVLSLR